MLLLQLLLLLLLLQRGGRLGGRLAAVAVAPATADSALITPSVRQQTLVHLKREGERERWEWVYQRPSTLHGRRGAVFTVSKSQSAFIDQRRRPSFFLSLFISPFLPSSFLPSFLPPSKASRGTRTSRAKR